MEETKQLIIMNREDLSVKKIVLIDTIIPVQDIISPQKTTFEIEKINNIKIGDLVLLKNQNIDEYLGVIQDIEEENTLTLSTYPLINITDTDCILNNINGSVGSWIIEELSYNFVETLTANNSELVDNLLSLPFEFEDRTDGETLKLEVSNGNLFDVLIDIFKKTGIYLSFSLKYENGIATKVKVTIQKTNENDIITIKYDNPLFAETPDVEFSQNQNLNKVIFTPSGTNENEKNIYVFYLYDNNTVGQNPNGENGGKRISGVVQQIQEYSDDDFTKGLSQKAQELLVGNNLDHQITVKIINNDAYDFQLYKKVIYIDKDRTYETYVTRIENYNNVYKTLRLGVLRTTLTDKLKSLEKLVSKSRSTVVITNSSGGGGSGSTTDIYDGLDSNSATSALSARQGKVLKGLIDGVKSDLTDYYTKGETFSQEEIRSLISTIPKFSIKVVSSLPTTDIDNYTVYLLKSGEQNTNLYTEYIYVDSKWEQLGTQELDLSGYLLITDFNETIKNYYTKSYIDEEFENKVSKEVGKGLSTNDLTDALLNLIENNTIIKYKHESLRINIDQIQEGVYYIKSGYRIGYNKYDANDYYYTTTPTYLFVTNELNSTTRPFYIFTAETENGVLKPLLISGDAFTGSLYEIDLSKQYLTKNTDETVTGKKKFSYAPTVSEEIELTRNDNSVSTTKWVTEKVDGVVDGKQDKLVAGENIKITGNIISATGGGSGGGSIPTLESPVRIWNLNSGIYLVPKDATIYYNGATSESAMSYQNDTPSVLIVKYHLNEEGTADLENKRYMLFSYSNEAQSYLAFIQGSTTEVAGSYSTDYCFTKTYKDAVDGIRQNGYVDTKTSQTIKGAKTFEDDITGTILNAYNDGDGNSISGTYLKKTENAVSSTKATQDGEGNVISDTYVDKSTDQEIYGQKTFASIKLMVNQITNCSGNTVEFPDNVSTLATLNNDETFTGLKTFTRGIIASAGISDGTNHISVSSIANKTGSNITKDTFRTNLGIGDWVGSIEYSTEYSSTTAGSKTIDLNSLLSKYTGTEFEVLISFAGYKDGNYRCHCWSDIVTAKNTAPSAYADGNLMLAGGAYSRQNCNTILMPVKRYLYLYFPSSYTGATVTLTINALRRRK